jgi:hypothetical protein
MKSNNPISRITWPSIVTIMGLLLVGYSCVSLYKSKASPSLISQAERTVKHRPICEIKLGDRVPGENPIETPDERYGKTVDQATWRQVDLRCQKRDGTFAEVSLLRPLTWLNEHNAKVGGDLFISVPECGINGNATVLKILPCPVIQPGEGNVVIGTYRHHNAEVIDLKIGGLDRPIGTTANHRFWDEGKQSFERADSLNLPFSKRSKAETVYNLETYPHHVYRVSAQALLVHNAGPIPLASFDTLFNLPVSNGDRLVLLHGTTAESANSLMTQPPRTIEGGFSAASSLAVHGPKNPLSSPIDYANAQAIRQKTDAAILVVEVPKYLLNKNMFNGVSEIRFEKNDLERLQRAWKSLPKSVIHPQHGGQLFRCPGK